jgi:hypothetical protein
MLKSSSGLYHTFLMLYLFRLPLMLYNLIKWPPLAFDQTFFSLFIKYPSSLCIATKPSGVIPVRILQLLCLPILFLELYFTEQ